VGHSPFLENPERFDTELDAFTSGVAGGRARYQ
jgi:hypothetical protein